MQPNRRSLGIDGGARSASTQDITKILLDKLGGGIHYAGSIGESGKQLHLGGDDR